MVEHVLALNLVGLTREHLKDAPNLRKLAESGNRADLKTPVPAVTCTVQSTLTTGKAPRQHGVVANGWFDRTRMDVEFWEQPVGLVEADRTWDVLKHYRPDAKVGVLFWQNSLYGQQDIMITPKPVHLSDGEMMWCYSKPAGYYERLTETLGDFDLKSYWGPLTSIEGSKWIAGAACDVIKEAAPELLYVYLPHLDYNAQRHGPDSEEAKQDLMEVDEQVGRILGALDEAGIRDETAVLAFGEYAIEAVNQPVMLNQALREAGLLEVREIKGKEYLDMERSLAFAVVDHQIAHVYCKPGAEDQAAETLRALKGVGQVVGESGKRQLGLNHERSGELVAIADEGAWFAYYYWTDEEKAPPFAREVDIHNKPGYDPVELFVDAKTKSIPLTPGLVKGSHGRPPTAGSRLPTLVADVPSGKNPLKDRRVVDATEVHGMVLRLLGVDKEEIPSGK